MSTNTPSAIPHDESRQVQDPEVHTYWGQTGINATPGNTATLPAGTIVSIASKQVTIDSDIEVFVHSLDPMEGQLLCIFYGENRTGWVKKRSTSES